MDAVTETREQKIEKLTYRQLAILVLKIAELRPEIDVEACFTDFGDYHDEVRALLKGMGVE